MTREELKPCPFCGRSVRATYFGCYVGSDKYAIFCRCGIRTEASSWRELVDFWNRRVPRPLKRWTEKDGIPPDGVYLIDSKGTAGEGTKPSMSTIEIGRSKGYHFVAFRWAGELDNEPIERLYRGRHAIYGPVILEEPASGEPGGAE